MFKPTLIMTIFALSLSLSAEVFPAKFDQQIAQKDAIQHDLNLILHKGGWPVHGVTYSKEIPLEQDQVKVVCDDQRVHLFVHAKETEWGPTFYYGLHKLGFYFPHPRWQVSPTVSEAREHCGKTYFWKPRLKYRGFHLHTQHPSEWVHGFLMGKTEMANELVRWLARNGQNVFQVRLLRQKHKKIKRNFEVPFQLAGDLGVSRGVAIGINFQQQKSYQLVSLLQTLLGLKAEKSMRKKVRWFNDNLDYEFMNLEIGSSEFSSVDYEKTLRNMELVREELRAKNKQLFIKIHTSSNQIKEPYGNYNFLPQYSHPGVGVYPHTVMVYGVTAEVAPVYGNKNKFHIRDFMIQEKTKRATWYYPETSYFIAMDIDVPIFLTDYLVERSHDMDLLEREGIEGQMNFTTGHELGYWMMDWTVALLAFSDYAGNPRAGLDLLGEDAKTWQEILDFQTEFVVKRQALPLISSANVGDELFPKHMVHKRVLFRHLRKQPEVLQAQIDLLEEAVSKLPSLDGIKHPELKALMEITWQRFEHALLVRKGMREPKKSDERKEYITQAASVRAVAQEHINFVMENYDRYPLAKTFSRHKNPTSYKFGYGWTASNLHFWHREEEMVRRRKYSPFFMNIINLWEIVF